MKNLNNKDIQHIYRRMGIGVNRGELDRVAGWSQSEVIADILEKARNEAPLEEPFYKEYGWMQLIANDDIDFGQIAEIRLSDWFVEAQQNPFLAKIKLFWLNHFVAQYSAYETAPILFEYQNCLHKHALGNFKDFVYDIGLTGAMLIYLSGEVNEKTSPNENYARELYELFTLGEGNGYTEFDITQTARALTGYRVENYEKYEVYFEAEYYDDGEKNIFGQVGNWGYDDVIDILFEERASLIARFISQKLYSFFVHPDNPEDPLIGQLANSLIENNFELFPVYQLLFNSASFMSIENRSCFVKSPVDCIASLANDMGLNFQDEAYNYIDDAGLTHSIPYSLALFWAIGEMGQWIYDPVDVAGWKGNRTWLNSNSLVERWGTIDFVTWKLVSTIRDPLIDHIKFLSNNSTDPEVVTSSVVEYMVQSGFYTNSSYTNALDVFKGEVPENYFESGRWNLDWENAIWQVLNLMRFIGRQPEFMLQ